MLKNKRFLWVVCCIILLLPFVAGCSMVRSFQAPIAPTMGLSTATLPATLDVSAETDLPQVPTSIPTATPDVVETCGQSGSMNILFIGSDVIGGVKPNGADTIRLVKINFDAKSIKVVTFPRSMIVETASTLPENSIQTPIGLAYFDAYEAASGTPMEKNAIGARVVAQLLQSNFNVRPDYYLTMQMDQIAAMVDTIGGVEINIPAEITTEHDITFPAGVQTLDGALATEYIRFLTPGGEAARNLRQNEFIKALRAKVISLEILPQIPALIPQFKNALITDLSLEQLISIVCVSTKMQEGSTSFYALENPELMTENNPNVEAIKEYLDDVLSN